MKSKGKKKRIYEWCPNGYPATHHQDIIYSDKRRRIRCPLCNRRLLLQERIDEDGKLLIGYQIPPHKTYKNIAKKEVNYEKVG